MFRTRRVRRDERQIDVGLCHAGKFDLRLFRRFLQSLHRQLIARKVDALFRLEFGNQIIHDAFIEVVAAEHVVAVGRKHFEYAVADLHDGDIERAAAEVVNDDLLALAFFIEPVRQSRRGRFVDDTKHVEPRNLARVLGRLSLAVGKICRAGDDGVRRRAAEITFRILFQF